MSTIVDGKVKWFNKKRGFGFIVSGANSADVFVHYSSIEGNGYKILEEGEAITFELAIGERGPYARNVRRVRE